MIKRLKPNFITKLIIAITILLLSVVMVWLTCFMMSVIKDENFSWGIFSSTASELKVDETYELDFNKIMISAQMGEVEVKSGGDKVKLRVYSDNDNIEVVHEEDVLSVETKNDCTGFCWGKRGQRIEITIPESYDGLTKIRNNMGAIEAEKLSGTVNIHNDMGAIEIGELNLTGDSEIHNNMGSIEIGKTNEIYIDASADMGSVEVKNNYRGASVMLELRNNMGSIEVNN